MDNVFRIDIPITVTDKTNTASLQKLQREIADIFKAANQGGSAGNAFRPIEQGAQQAAEALEQTNETIENTVKTTGNIDTVNGTITTFGAAAQEASEGVDDLGESAGDASKEVEGLGKAAQGAGQQAGPAFDGAGQSADRFTQRVERSQKTLRQMFAEKFKLTLAVLDKVSPALKTITKGIKSVAGKAWNVVVKMTDMVTAPFRKIYDLVTSPITMAISMAGIGMGANDFLNTYTDFTTGMSTVQALTRDANEGTNMQDLIDQAQYLGASTQFTAAQAAEGMQYLGMAGWYTADIKAAMPGMLDLAAAGGTDLGTAADIISDVMTAIGMKAGDASTAADVFAKTATATNTTIEMLGETMKYAAPVAQSFGLDLQELSTAAGMMANAGIKGSQAGTSLRSSLLRMSSPTAEMEKTMKKLGISFSDSSGKMKSMKEIVHMLADSFSGLSEADKLTYAQDIFGTEAASAWLGIINQGTKAYDDLEASIYASKNAAKDMANTRMDNLQGDMTYLQSAVDGMKISLMDKLNPYLRSAVQWITEKIPQITEFLSGAIDTIISKAQDVAGRFKDLFNSNEFQNADFADKIFIAWDKIIAEPFTEWWNGGGQKTILNALSSLGESAGSLLKGIITGIFSAIKGDDIDADNMGLSGLAAAGAQAAGSFMSSFMDNFDIGEVIGEAPGALTAGVVGFGALDALGNVSDIVEGVQETVESVTGPFEDLKDLLDKFGGAADDAAGSGGMLAGVLGGLKGVVSAIPVWGWVAVAAIGAIGGGIYMYNKHLKEQREHMIELGQAVEESTKDFQDTAQEVYETSNNLDDLNRRRHKIEFQLNVAQTGLTETQISGMQDRLTKINGLTSELTLKITSSGNLTAEQATNVASQLAQIKTDTITVTAAIMSTGGTEQDQNVFDLLEKYDLAQFDPVVQASVAADIEAQCADPSKAETVRELLKKYSDPTLNPIEKAEVAAQIAANVTGNTKPGELLGLMKEYRQAASDPNSGDISVEAWLQAHCEDKTQYEQLLPLFQQYAALVDNEANITASLNAGGVSQDEVDMLQQLADLMVEKDKLTLAIDAGGMSEEEVSQLKGQYEEILNTITELTGGVVNATELQGAALDANLAKYQEELRNERELARLRSQEDIRKAEESMPQVVEEEQTLRSEAEQHKARIAELEVAPAQITDVRSRYNALEEERAGWQEAMEQGKITEDNYWNYLNLENGYYDRATGIVADYLTAQGYSTESAQEEAKRQIGSLKPHAEGLDSLGEGGFDVILDDYLTQNAAEQASEREKLQNVEGQADQLATTRTDWYNASVATNIVGEYFKDTEFDGKSMQEIAGSYGQFVNDPVMLQRWESAMTALDELNVRGLESGYVSEDEIVTVDQLNQIKDQSFANAPTAAEEGGEPTINPMQAYSTLVTQTQLSNGDTKFTRDLRANAEAWQNASETERPQIEAERAEMVTSQQTAIRMGIDGINALTTQIQTKAAELETKRGEVETRKTNYENAESAIQAAQTAYANGGSAEEAVKAVNQQLEGLNMEKIDTITQIGDALERIGNAKTGDQTMLTELTNELGQLKEDQVNLMLKTADAMDTLTWNINQINSDANLSDELKFDQATIDSVNNMQLAMADAGSAANGLKSNCTTTREAVDSFRGSINTAKTSLDELAGDYEVTISYVFQQTGAQTVNVPGIPHANGGFVDRATYSLIGEDGPEAIIPLGEKRRGRGLDLWRQAGEALGASEFMDGGVAAPYAGILASLPDDEESGAGGETTASSISPSISVSVDASPTYQINGNGSPDDVIAVIQSHQNELAEMFGSAIAAQLEDIVSNMV